MENNEKKFSKKERYELMGKIVTIFKYYEKVNNNNTTRYEIETIENGRSAWIVGFGNIYCGKTEYDDYGQYFKIEKTLKIIKVVFNPTSKIYRIPYDGFVLGGNKPDYREYNWGDDEHIKKFKKIISEDMKHWPRNKKGHWIKKEVINE